MKKSFLKGASIFLASVLTVGMCSAYSVNAKAKFSLPKKTTSLYIFIKIAQESLDLSAFRILFKLIS